MSVALLVVRGAEIVCAFARWTIPLLLNLLFLLLFLLSNGIVASLGAGDEQVVHCYNL